MNVLVDMHNTDYRCAVLVSNRKQRDVHVFGEILAPQFPGIFSYGKEERKKARLSLISASLQGPSPISPSGTNKLCSSAASGSAALFSYHPLGCYLIIDPALLPLCSPAASR